MTSSPVVAAATLALLLSLAAAASAQPSPEAMYNQAVNYKPIKDAAANKAAGEQFCWHARTSLGHFVRGYKAYGDTAWLDWGVKYYDFLIGAMQTGPDGYKGWIGPYIYKPAELWADVHVGDAILMEGILEFAELVLKDEKLKEKYGAKANEYVAIARRDIMEKWDARGTWYEDGEIGGYVGWHTFAKPGKVNEKWERDPAFRGNSLPFNKHMDMAMVALTLYRITGEEAYRERARKIFNFQKIRMTVVDGNHYAWNYWEPMGQMDIDLEARDTSDPAAAGTKLSGMKHWVNTHGYRNYQAGEVAMIVEAYHNGLTFDQKDIELIIATNLKVMWNGDKESPKFVNSNVRIPRTPLTPEQEQEEEKKFQASSYAKEGRAGTLWTALVDFDPTIRELYERQLNDRSAAAQVSKAYYENVTKKRPPSFERHHKELPVTVFEALPRNAAALTLTAALPYEVALPKAEGEKQAATLLISKANLPGKLEVALVSADGKEKLAVLHDGEVPGGTDGHAGVFILPWNLAANGKTLTPGQYRIRWTFGGQSTEYPLVVKQATGK